MPQEPERRSQALHYLDVLEKKRDALSGSKPLEQWRKLGRWPESFERLRQGYGSGVVAGLL